MSARAAIRILLVDDHPIIRAGLRSLIEAEQDLEVVGEAEDGRVAVELARSLQPDLVLMDLRMPKLDGASAAEALRAESPRTRVLIVTTYDSDADILRAVEAGAIGYLLKDAPARELVAAIRDAAAGRTVLAPSVAVRLVAHAADDRGAKLTLREIEILRLVAKGMRNREIGKALRIGESTVKTHLLHIFEKLDARDRTSAVTTAIERGIVRLEDG
ncbi:MAG: response regulator transcription factor [Kofleriaceae bacterium]